MTRITESGWDIETQKAEDGVRYVARSPTPDEPVEFTSALAYKDADEAIEEGNKFVADVTRSSRDCGC